MAMEAFAHDVEELERILAEIGTSAFDRAYLEYCAALLIQEEAALKPEERQAA
jgi:hypothetical protein